jgi:hypothetical protein
MRHPDPLHDKKTGIYDQLVKPLLSLFFIPSDIPVTAADMPGR